MQKPSYPDAIITTAMLTEEFRQIGLPESAVLCLHASLSKFGMMIGGAKGCLDGVLGGLGDKGTLMMPSYTGDLSDPSEWGKPPVPEEWFERIRADMPCYDPRRSPTWGLGAVAELFRTWPGVGRSAHPQSSFAAIGPATEQLLSRHPLDNRFGPDGPLGRLAEMEQGYVMLLGAPRDTISLFHLTQHLVDTAKTVSKSYPVMVDGVRKWVECRDVYYPIDWFEDGVAHLVETGIASTGRIGKANYLLFPAKRTVEEIVAWRQGRNI